MNAWERAWERQHAAGGLADQARARVAEVRWTAELEAETGTFDSERIEADPLALLRALDELLGAESPARWGFEEPYSVDGSEYWLVPVRLPRSAEAASAHQPGNLQSWLRHHRVVPADLSGDLHVRVLPSRDVTDTELGELRAREKLIAFVAHFIDGAALDPSPSGKFFVRGLSEEEARCDGALAALRRAIEEGANLVVFPELTITPSHRDGRIRDRLRAARREGRGPILTVPGSFHEEVQGGGGDPSQRRRVNRALLLGADGRELLRHAKLRIYGEAEGPAEDIDSASILEVLVTPIGIVAVAICKDFCDEYSPLHDCHRLAFVDWWLVPSMGDEKTVEAHREQAKTHWKISNRCTTLVANQEVPGGDPAVRRSLPGFAYDGRDRRVAPGGSSVTITFAISGRGRSEESRAPRPGLALVGPRRRPERSS